MPILVLVNGSPGTGKTTLARRWVADHPLSFALDIDTIRSMVGGWRDDESNAGKLARDLSRSMIHTPTAALPELEDRKGKHDPSGVQGTVEENPRYCSDQPE